MTIEAGQCDLLLISYLGIDFQNQGQRVYRLLDSTLSFSGDASALNVCGYKNADITQALTDARDASKTAAEQKAAWDKFQKLELDDSPLVWTNLQGLLAAGTTKVHGLNVINSPYGPQLNTVYMTK